jgi:14-3-3 protein epsilon
MAETSSMTCEENIFMAKLAEQAERYEEMKDYMKLVVKHKKRLSTEERNLLSVAYKNVVGARRASWRVLNSIMSKESDKESLASVQQYKESVEKELSDICEDVLTVLTDVLLANKEIEHEERVFYYKMKGDYHRYMAEYLADAKGEETIEEAKNSYQDAMEAAKSLSATNPIRLGLALNFSVFYYEILNKPKKACELAKEAFDTAVGELEDLNEDQYKDATLIMQLLRDNLTLWQSEDAVERDMDEMRVEQDGTEVSDIS